MSKGDLTRSRILDAAMQLASRAGLDGLTIGSLSEALSLSKSGLFAHFGSKEALQLAVLEHTRNRFGEHLEARIPGASKGLARLRAYFAAWLDWIASPDLPAGCPILGAMFEFEAREGAPRDFLIKLQMASRERLTDMVRSAMDSGELRQGVDVAQVIFELRAIALAFHQELHVLRSPAARDLAEKAFSTLLERYAPEAKPKAKRVARTPGRRRDAV